MSGIPRELHIGPTHSMAFLLPLNRNVKLPLCRHVHVLSLLDFSKFSRALASRALLWHLLRGVRLAGFQIALFWPLSWGLLVGSPQKNWRCIFAEAHPQTFSPPNFVRPTLALLRAFPGVFESESFRTQPQTSKHRRSWGGDSAWVFDLVARIRARIFYSDGAVFFLQSLAGKFRGVFNCAKRCTHKIHTKIDANFENIYPTVFCVLGP